MLKVGDGLRRLSAQPLTLTHTIGGALRVELPGTVDWSALRALLRDHDLDLRLADGVVTLVPTAEGDLDMAQAPLPTATVSGGPVVCETYGTELMTSAHLDALSAQPDVLRVVIVDGLIRVDRVTRSDIKDGLFHLHKRGRVRPRSTAAQGRGVFSTSTAAKRAQTRSRLRQGVVARAAALVWS